MTTFVWAALAVIIVGMVIPFWIMVILTMVIVQRTPKKAVDPSRAINYAELNREFTAIFEKDNGGRFNGPTMVACIRDLKKFPEYRDASVLLLEEINITGSGKFDDMAKTEIKRVEAYLLGLKDD